MKKAALTGFGLFSNHSVNPAQLLAENLREEDYIGSRVIPVSYRRCFSSTEGLEGDVLLMVGLAAGRKDISLERYAYNEMKATIPDTDGELLSGEPIEPDGEPMLETPFDLEPLLSLLASEGIPSHVSTDPGRYVCNSLYYRSLHDGSRPALFIHVPSLEDMDYDTMERAIKRIVLELLEHQDA